MYYDNKYEYLESKSPKLPCLNMCKEYSEILGETVCGTCFWNNIILPYENIPECSRCVKDFEELKKNIKNNNGIITVRLECTENCLWFEWFENKRKIIVTNNNKEVKYTKKNIIENNSNSDHIKKQVDTKINNKNENIIKKEIDNKNNKKNK